MAKQAVSAHKTKKSGKAGKTKPPARALRKSSARAAKPKASAPKRHAQRATKAVAKVLSQKPTAMPREARPAGVPENLRDAALAVLNERKAEDVLIFDLTGRSAMADYLIVASGRASKQLVALAHHLGDAFAKLGAAHPRIEGVSEANWVLVDAGDVIVHLFRPEVRRYYDLESLWQD